MSIKIIERPALAVVGMQIETRPLSPEIPALWSRFAPRIPEIPGITEPKVSYGVMWDDGSMQVLHYIAAVAASGPAPRGMTSRVIPAGSYAFFRYPLADLGKGFGEIFNSLLPKSPYTTLPTPHLERYDESFDPADPQSLVEIWLPVKRRAP
jgi:AraC family transcriptional regulator